MSQPSPLSQRLQQAFGPNARGVVGIVDELLALCREQPLRLEWHNGGCRVRRPGSAAQEAVDVSLPKSVFRAVLARIAALCNEQTPDSVSPYAGAAGLSAGTTPPTVFHAAFTNTPAEQRLELRYAGERSESAAAPSAPLRATEPAHVAPPGSA